MKTCKDCKENKNEKEFYVKRQLNISKGGASAYSYSLESRCKKCKNKRDTANKNRSPQQIEKNRIYQKNYHLNYKMIKTIF